MARISGVDIPREKRLEIALTYIYGIGPTLSKQITDAVDINPSTRVRDLTDEEVAKLRTYIDQAFRVEGDLRRVRRWPGFVCFAIYFFTFFFPATVFFGPLRVRALVWVRCPWTGNPLRWRTPW